jgi:hypothetical protein
VSAWEFKSFPLSFESYLENSYIQRFLATLFGRKNSSDETRGLKKGGLRRKKYWDKSEHGMKVEWAEAALTVRKELIRHTDQVINTLASFQAADAETSQPVS